MSRTDGASLSHPIVLNDMHDEYTLVLKYVPTYLPSYFIPTYNTQCYWVFRFKRNEHSPNLSLNSFPSKYFLYKRMDPIMLSVVCIKWLSKLELTLIHKYMCGKSSFSYCPCCIRYYAMLVLRSVLWVGHWMHISNIAFTRKWGRLLFNSPVLYFFSGHKNR